MTLVTSAQALKFISESKFPAAVMAKPAGVADTPPVVLKSTEAQSLVVGSGLVVAAENVPRQTREDLVNCTLFAQLAASGEVADPAKVNLWYDAYFRALTALGWSQSDSNFEDYEFKSGKAEAHKAVIQVLAALLGPQAAAIAVVKTAIEALQSMEANSPWITLFDRQSKVGKSARFQVATAQVDPGGLIQVALCAFSLKAASSQTQVLFFRYSSSSTRLKYAAGKATIYVAALKQVRAQVAERLAAYRSSYVGQVKFPPA